MVHFFTQLQNTFYSQDNSFIGLPTVKVENISNLVIGMQEDVPFIKFNLIMALNYNHSVPVVQNLSSVIAKAQRTSFTECIFSSADVTVLYITSPLTITWYVNLDTRISAKSSIIDNTYCTNQKTTFITACTDAMQLTKCNETSLNEFLNNYVTHVVIVLYI